MRFLWYRSTAAPSLFSCTGLVRFVGVILTCCFGLMFCLTFCFLVVESAAGVVASAKTGAEMIEDSSKCLFYFKSRCSSVSWYLTIVLKIGGWQCEDWRNKSQTGFRHYFKTDRSTSRKRRVGFSLLTSSVLSFNFAPQNQFQITLSSHLHRQRDSKWNPRYVICERSCIWTSPAPALWTIGSIRVIFVRLHSIYAFYLSLLHYLLLPEFTALNSTLFYGQSIMLR